MGVMVPEIPLHATATSWVPNRERMQMGHVGVGTGDSPRLLCDTTLSPIGDACPPKVP